MVLWNHFEHLRKLETNVWYMCRFDSSCKNIIGYEEAHIGAMDITVERNAFGRQRDSFEAALDQLKVLEKNLLVYLFVHLIL